MRPTSNSLLVLTQEGAFVGILQVATAKQAIEDCLGACKRMMNSLANVNIPKGAPEMPSAIR